MKLVSSFMKIAVCIMTALFAAAAPVYAHGLGYGEFSDEERSYINEKKLVRVAAADDYAPVSFFENGEPGGLSAVVLERFEEQTGMKIEYIKADSYIKAAEMVKNGSADIMALFAVYPAAEQAEGIRAANPYLESDTMMIYGKNAKLKGLKEYTIAQIKGYPKISSNRDINYMTFNTPGECLSAVRAGHADAMYCDIYTAMSYMQSYENRELVSAPVTVRLQISFGVSDKTPPVLDKLLNRTIGSIGRRDINTAIMRAQAGSKESLGDFVYRYPFEIISIILALAFLMTVLTVVYMRVKSRQSISLHGYENSYRMLADTMGGAGFGYDYIKDKMTVFGKYAHKLAIPQEISSFSAYLDNSDKDISFTRSQFEKLLDDGMKGKSYAAELTCKNSDGAWQHFRLIFSVISTDESHNRPIRMVGCLINKEEEYIEKERLLKLGLYDNITSLLNRDGAEREINERFRRGKGTGTDVIMLIDVDCFKQFKDIYGHQCGDDVLMQTGRGLKELFGTADILCRWGGDEFLIYLKDKADRIESVTQKCGELQERMSKYVYNEKHIPVTLSIGGVVVTKPSLKEAFRAADNALYYVKKNGRNSIYIESEFHI